jgi:hypothetical protein
VNGFGYALVAGFLLWLGLASNGFVRGPVATFRALVTMGTRNDPQASTVRTPKPEAIVAPKGHAVRTACPDGDRCAHGGRHWPDREQLETETFDPNDITTVSREGVNFVDLSGDDRYKTSAWKAREKAEQAAREVDGIDLSFLDGASPAERREWVESWRRTHQDMPRSEIAQLLSKYAKIKIRQAQIDVRNALGPLA